MALTLIVSSARSAQAEEPPVEGSTGADAAIIELLHDYEAALNAADVEAIVALYEPDAVFMAQHRPPAIGTTDIRTAYTEVFDMIRLDVVFTIDEVETASRTLAWARTRSSGTTTIVANGAEVAEGNSEIFLLSRETAESTWQISRYIFSTTQPRN